MGGYLVYSILMTGLVYPIVAHWVWSEEGWLAKMDMIDFAGCGVVHITGGWMALVGAHIIGPRADRFVISSKGTKVLRNMRPSNVVLQALGVFILWFGWYGFNAGSTFQVTDGAIFKAAKIAINTTLSGAAASLMGIGAGKLLRGYFDLVTVINCSLAGLVSITASCNSVTPLASICIGMVGALFYVAASETILHFHIDDPVDAFPIHGAAGVWGLLAVGIFSSDPNAKFEVQLLGAVVIAMWSTFFGFIIFKCCDKTIGLRVSSEIEAEGIDVHEHGGSAFTTDVVWTLDDVLSNRATRKALMKFMKAKFSEENLEFLLECNVLFDALDMDIRIEFLSEERTNVPAVIEVKKHVHDLITHIVETYVVVMSEKEININSQLKNRISLTFKGEAVSGRCITTTAPKNKSLSERIGFSRASVEPITDGFLDIGNADNESQEDPTECLKTVLSDDDGDDCNTEMTAALTSTTGNAKERADRYASSRSVSLSGTLTTKSTRKISREFVQNIMDAYKEIHRLIFQNFYFGFSHTEDFSKAKMRAEAISRRK